MKKVLYKQFEDRQKIREEEMLRLEKRLQELKENLAEYIDDSTSLIGAAIEQDEHEIITTTHSVGYE